MPNDMQLVLRLRDKRPWYKNAEIPNNMQLIPQICFGRCGYKNLLVGIIYVIN